MRLHPGARAQDMTRGSWSGGGFVLALCLWCLSGCRVWGRGYACVREEVRLCVLVYYYISMLRYNNTY